MFCSRNTVLGTGTGCSKAGKQSSWSRKRENKAESRQVFNRTDLSTSQFGNKLECTASGAIARTAGTRQEIKVTVNKRNGLRRIKI